MRIGFCTKIFALAAAVLLCCSAVASAQEEYRRGYDLYRQGQYRQALQIFQRVVEEYPEWHFGQFMLGKCHKALGNRDDAITALARSVELADNEDASFNSNYELADLYYEARSYARALEYVNACKRLSSSRYYARALPNLRVIEGFSLFNRGQHQQAINAFKPMVDDGSASANVLKTYAKCYQELGQNNEAVRIIQQVVQMDPNDLAAHKILVKSYLNGGQLRNAIQAADFALRTFPEDWELHYLRGNAYFQQSRSSAQAVSSLREAVRLSSRVHYVNKMLGDAYAARGEWANAAQQYNIAQAGSNQNGDSYASDPIFYYNFAFAWYAFVPEDCQRFHNTSEQGRYQTALENAQGFLDRAEELGFDAAQINGMRLGINNKNERLEKGLTTTVEMEGRINPETGQIEWVPKDQNDQ